ncbi:MAG TPA: diguanylate cyclase [Casimicrobium huifangae]|jgi:diguanylate cyclase (GGDEF)-like protein|uniref:diguanylate cyclase n=1 Tax=Casimicrobium huifangae TaxID=2591109 RepID=UPI0012EC086D|nr:diguanylate cyclase [Casimicrobium huifangae]HOB01051.1 diguanylate cyclase [Casimicrobium huifangae]HQA32566.1 diguanylate cyclase [Casimicrobium huifangae]HQD64821.1 diguanylate cyclase [Casimicrobium huifangae]
MSIRVKFNLLLVAIFLLSLVGAAWYYHHALESDAISDVRQNSQVLMETALAIRSYTTDEIKPHLDPLNDKRFLPQTVPAFAATETLRRLRDRFPAYEYKEAVLNPTNPRDRASDWERTLIEKFRADATQTELTGLQGEGVQRSVYVARPIIIKQAQCLACHSVPAAAPASMLQIYGEKNGFGWQMNETIGMQVVKLPMLYPLEKARRTFYSFMWSLLCIFGLMFLALNLVMSGLVIEPMARVNKQLEELATKDFLTDLVNRRRFFEHLESAMADARIHNTGLSVVMFDLDFFKRINDTFGHDSGDVVLKNTALRVRELLRGSDCAARFGGEEFIILLRETRIDAALAIAEAVRSKIATVPYDLVGAVSASFGVAEWNTKEDARALINRADRALYVAKQTGRNRVIRADETTEAGQV